MTDVLIKNWCIPKCCMDCDPDFAYAIKCKAYNENNDFTRQRAENCPLVEIKHSQDGDTISRADAIELFEKYKHRMAVSVYEYGQALKELPSAEAKTKCIAQIKIDRDDLEDLVNEKVNEIVDKMSETKTGEWIFRTDIPIGGGRESAGYVCSNCRKDYFHVDGMNFCPHCGAKMTPCKGGDD